MQEALGGAGPDEDDDIRTHLRSGYPASPALLAECRSERLRRLHALLGESLALLDGEQVKPDCVAELAAGWPSWVRVPPSVTCYVQPLGDGPVRLVVNVVTGGHGRGRGRWSRVAGQAGVPGSPGPCTPGGDWVAELTGNFESSLDLCAPVASHVIDYPYTSGHREERIALGELVVERDQASGSLRLRCPRLRTTVFPVHSGMMSDLLLPPVARLLITAFGTGYLRHPAWPVGTTLDRPGQVTARLPRIEIGRVVVQRARWTFPADAVPVRRKGESSAERLLPLMTWLRAEQLPTRMFARLVPAEADWGERAFDKSRKPVFIDFSSVWLVEVLDTMLRGWTGLVAFEEALPDPAARVTECLVELTGAGG